MITTPPDARSIMLRLREDTAELHRRAEQSRLQRQLVRGQLARDAYTAWLGQMHLIHTALDHALQSAQQQDSRLARVVRPEQLHAANIAADLQFFGSDAQSIEPLPATSAFIVFIEKTGTIPSAILGIHYVLEGSKNGARYIAKAIQRAFSLEWPAGLQALDPHGEEQPALWGAFKQRMDELPLDDEERAAIIQAACATFDFITRMNDELADRLGIE